jgi:asparagine synthase
VRQAAVKAGAGLSRLGIREVSSLFDFDDPEDLIVTWRGWLRKELEILFGENVKLSDSAFYRAVHSARNGGGQAIYDAVAIYPIDDCRLASAALWGLEICFPYHDMQLQEFVRALPRQWRYQQNESKVLLRRLYEKYYPERVWRVRKKYFNFPLHRFLSHDQFRIVREHLAPTRIRNMGLLDPERITPWIDRYVAGDQSLQFKIWSLLVLHAWFESRN